MDRRQFVAAVGGAALTASVRSAQGQAEEPRSDEDPAPGSRANEQRQTTILFFDDQRLNLRDNVQRKIGRPALISESVYQDPRAHVGWGYPGVFRDEASGKWRMTYLAWARGRKRTAALAESDDGLHGSPRDTTREIDLPDRILPNQVLPLDRFGEWPASFVDGRAPAAQRLKGLVVYHTSKNHCRTRLWVSPDGIHWKLKEGVEWQKVGPDPGTQDGQQNAVFVNDFLGLVRTFERVNDLARRGIEDLDRLIKPWLGKDTGATALCLICD